MTFPSMVKLKYELISNSESTIHNSFTLFTQLGNSSLSLSLAFSHKNTRNHPHTHTPTHPHTHTHTHTHTPTPHTQAALEHSRMHRNITLKSCLICQNCSEQSASAPVEGNRNYSQEKETIEDYRKGKNDPKHFLQQQQQCGG